MLKSIICSSQCILYTLENKLEETSDTGYNCVGAIALLINMFLRFITLFLIDIILTL